MNTPATGALFSPVDYRDKIATASAIAPVFNFALPLALPKQFLGGVMMQAQEPDCVLFATTKLLKLYWFLKTGVWIDFSPRFLAILIKRYDGQDRATGGTFPRLAMKLVSEYGCCTTKLLPNDTTLPVLTYRKDSLLTQAMFDEAAQYKVPGYVGIPVDFVRTRQALVLFKAVSTLFEVGDELWTPGWAKSQIDPMRTPARIESGHQMVQNGYVDSVYNNVENQWSEAWADGGANQFDYKAWIPFINEQWVVAEIPDDIKDFLKVLPAPADFHYQWNANMSAGMVPNKDVQMLQVALMILGYLEPVDPESFGYFGPKTSLANAQLQRAAGIRTVAPANVGPLTRAYLNTRFSL